MWQSKADIINDLAALNDFGDPGNTTPYVIFHSVGRGSKPKEKTPPKTLLDPRTGEEFELDEQSLSIEDTFKGKGRGTVLSNKSYALLHKQLRLARPLGSGDEIFESFYKKNNSVEQETVTSVKDNGQPDDEIEKPCDTSYPVNSSKVKSRVKAVRNSNSVNNALISSLLKAKEISLMKSNTERTYKSNEPDIIDKNSGVLHNSFKNLNNVTNKISFAESDSDDALRFTSEDAMSESLSNSSESNIIPEGLNIKKEMRCEDCKSFSTSSCENFNADSSFSEEAENASKLQNDIRNAAFSMSTNQNLDKVEIYRKLGEKMNERKKENCNKVKRDCFPMKNLDFNKAWDSQDLSNYNLHANEFLYDELHFPPLVKND